MKKILSAFILFLAVAWAPLFAKGQRTGGQTVNTKVIELFAAGQSTAALAYLQANTPPESGAGGATTAQVQALVDITCTLYNQRRLSLAKEVLVQALTVSEGLNGARSVVPDQRRATLFSGLGVLSERVLLDLPRAEAYYTAAATLSPSDPVHEARKQAVMDKQQKSRARAGGS
jgi:hypothetical protein